MIAVLFGIAAASAAAPIVVEGHHDNEGEYNRAAKLDHILPEIYGSQITVTKKTSVTKLDQEPPIIDNDVNELFLRTPGVLVSEQGTPTQYNLSYRGLGNPQESEFVLVLQDGIPIQSDWIGFPTLYYVPVPQSLSEVQTVRGGSSLLYGPEPAPAINFISKRPNPKGPELTGLTQQIGGSNGLYSTYNEMEGASGGFEYRADLNYTRSDGERQNQKSYLLQGDAYFGYRPAEGQLVYLTYHGHAATAGNPGRISYPQFLTDPNVAPTPNNRDWVRRGAVVGGAELDLGNRWHVEAKAWYSTLQLYTRAAAAQPAAGPAPATTTLQDENFHNEGVDLRVRKIYGRGNAFSVGVTGTHSDAPFQQFTSTNLSATLGEHSGTPRLDQARNSYYGAVFAENVFRLPHRFHIVFSGRFDTERLRIVERVKPANLTRPLVDVDLSRTKPLFGVGVGNDFGQGNETYLTVSRGYRPLRFFDVASPFSNLQPGADADPPRSTSYEAGVHGTPVTGLFYDVSLFQIDFTNRIETQRLNATDVINVNTGATRHRGFEGEISYDFLAAGKDKRHLEVFANVSLLDATFTDSNTPDQVGKVPAFAPRYIIKAGITWRKEGEFNVAITGITVGSQFFQDSNLATGTGATLVPARVPAYKLFEIDGEYTVTPHVTLQAGIQNLGDERYYSRVFQTGLEPASGRRFFGGVKFGF